MTGQAHAWEYRLLSLAHEPLQVKPTISPETVADEIWVEQAYKQCRTLTAKHSRSFYLASALLPNAKRRAVRALYAFCRVSDDIVDVSRGNPALRWLVGDSVLYLRTLPTMIG